MQLSLKCKDTIIQCKELLLYQLVILFPIFPISLGILLLLAKKYIMVNFKTLKPEILWKITMNQIFNIDFLENIRKINFLSCINVNLLDKFISSSSINPENQHHVIFTTLITESYLNLLKKAVESAMIINITNSDLIIFALDQKSHDWCKKNHINSMYFKISPYINLTWRSIGRLKQIIQYIFICKRCDTIFFDSDMIFSGNLKQDLIDKINEGVDIQMMNEMYKPRKDVDFNNIGIYNIGFMIISPNLMTYRLFGYWIRRCYYSIYDIWDQQEFNAIMGECKIISRNSVSKTILYRHFLNSNDPIYFKIHFLSPVKYITCCDLTRENSDNKFSSSSIAKILAYSRELNLKKPNMIHFACMAGKYKLYFSSMISMNDLTYEYIFNYLLKYDKEFDR